MLRNMFIIALGLAVFSGCASFETVQQPRLANTAQARRDVVRVSSVALYAKAVHTKEEMEGMFDDDMLKYDILPIRLEIVNNSGTDILVEAETIQLRDGAGAVRPHVSLESATAKAKKSYWRAAGWGALWIPLAIGSAIDVNEANKDVEQGMRNLAFHGGVIEPSFSSEGILFFQVPEELSSISEWRLEVPVRFIVGSGPTNVLVRSFDDAIEVRTKRKNDDDPARVYRDRVGG